MNSDKTQIPLCSSPFLQDFTIALGRRSFKSIRQAHSSLFFGVRNEEINGVVNERLDIEARSWLERMTKIAIWEDAEFWVYSRVRIGKPLRHPAFEISAALGKMNIDDIAELIRATLRDFDSVKHVWEQHAISR